MMDNEIITEARKVFEIEVASLQKIQKDEKKPAGMIRLHGIIKAGIVE